MSSFARARPRPNDPPEQVDTDTIKRQPNDFTWAPARPKRSHKGEPGKQAARTCTKPTLGHNLAFFIRACSPRHALARTTRLNDPPERVDMDAPKRPARTILHGRSHDQNEGTRGSRENELHELAQRQPPVTT